MRPTHPAPPAEKENREAPPADDTAGCATTLVLQTEAGRDAFLARAERQLPEGIALVRVKDIVGRRRAFHTAPKDPRAQLVARETPTILRGSLTALVSYYTTPLDGLDAVETHYENGEATHAYDVILSVARLGKARPRAAPVAAGPR